MIWQFLTSNIAQIGGAVLAILTALGIMKRRSRLKGRKDVTDAADKAARDRKDKRDEIESDTRPADAADELRRKWRRDQ